MAAASPCPLDKIGPISDIPGSYVVTARSSSDADVAPDPALDPNAAWAIAFRDSLNPDPLMQVVLPGIDNAKKTSKTGVPGAGGAPDSRGKTD